MVKVGLCGGGFMGKMHAACHASVPHARVVAVADVQPAVAQELAKKYGAVQVFAKAQDLIAQADVDMVDICLPTYLHAEHVLAAAKRGLNILCEKPMAMTVAEADGMVKAARKAKVIFMIAQVIRFWPEYQVLKEYVAKKKLGALKSVVFRRFGAMPLGWNRWFTQAKRSGGAALDLHIHDVDYVRYLFGDPQSLDSVGAFQMGAWNQIVTQYHYPKVAVTAEGGWWNAGEPFEMAFRAVFDKGVLLYSSAGRPLTQYQDGQEPLAVNVPQPKTGDVQAGGNISSLGGYFNEVKYFHDCLRANRQPEIVTPEDGRDAVALVYKEMASAARNARK